MTVFPEDALLHPITISDWSNEGFTGLLMFDRDAITIHRWLSDNPDAYPGLADLRNTLPIRRAVFLETLPRPWPDTAAVAREMFEHMDVDDDPEAATILESLPSVRRFESAWVRQLPEWQCPVINGIKRVRPADRRDMRYNPLLESILCPSGTH